MDHPSQRRTIAYGSLPADQAAALPRPGTHPPSPGGPPAKYRLAYRGEGGAFFWQLLKNYLLCAITLSIYTPWARTALRKFIIGNIDFHGQRLVYTGTGKELFFGYLKVLAVLVAWGVLSWALQAVLPREMAPFVVVSMLVPFYVALPIIIYASRSYLLSRTEWRGIRFGLDPAGRKPYWSACIGGVLLTIFTLSIYGPFLRNRLIKLMTDNTSLGSERFHYDGVGKEFFWIAFKGFLLSIVTLGIYSFWSQANQLRYVATHTRLGNARGTSVITGGTLMGVTLGVLFGSMFSFGIAFPFLATWALDTVLPEFGLEGHIDFDRIAQQSASSSATGDALASVMHVGLGV
jgi:uncharacterized membrane protein YjgN (DUF898 family)